MGFDSAQARIQGRSPLALDGIEVVAEAGYDGALFDHNNDGIKTATGWIGSDDGLLVLDRNNNGTIDNGLELFGDNTQLANSVTETSASSGMLSLKYDLIDDGGVSPISFRTLATICATLREACDADSTLIIASRTWPGGFFVEFAICLNRRTP